MSISFHAFRSSHKQNTKTWWHFRCPLSQGCCETPIKDATSSVTDQPFSAWRKGEMKQNTASKAGWHERAGERRGQRKMGTWVGSDDVKKRTLLNCRWRWKKWALRFLCFSALVALDVVTIVSDFFAMENKEGAETLRGWCFALKLFPAMPSSP